MSEKHENEMKIILSCELVICVSKLISIHPWTPYKFHLHTQQDGEKKIMNSITQTGQNRKSNTQTVS